MKWNMLAGIDIPTLVKTWTNDHIRWLCSAPKCAHEWDTNKQTVYSTCDWCKAPGVKL